MIQKRRDGNKNSHLHGNQGGQEGQPAPDGHPRKSVQPVTGKHQPGGQGIRLARIQKIH